MARKNFKTKVPESIHQYFIIIVTKLFIFGPSLCCAVVPSHLPQIYRATLLFLASSKSRTSSNPRVGNRITTHNSMPKRIHLWDKSEKESLICFIHLYCFTGSNIHRALPITLVISGYFASYKTHLLFSLEGKENQRKIIPGVNTQTCLPLSF